MDGKGRYEHFPEKPDTSKHSENTKDKTSRFHPVESTSELKEETKDRSGSGDSSPVKHDSPTDPYGLQWAKKQLDIVLNSGYLQRGDQASKDTQQLGDQTHRADAIDKPSEAKPQKSPSKQETIQARVADSAYRNLEAYMKKLGRIW